MEFMKDVPDKFYELAVVDPPYGETCKLTGGKAKENGYADYWDKITDNDNWNIAPNKEYFDQLFRVTQNQIIWGANHYPDKLFPSSGWIFWDKGQRDFSFSDGELAFTSFNKKLKAITIHRSELHKENRFHPTQKPVKLYEWILMNYAKQGDKILDTHGGSQSSRIACYNLGYALDIIELDQEYFEQGNKRFETHKQQLTLF
jgi:site-specific DNA-methyltransferase (adenine-specific)